MARQGIQGHDSGGSGPEQQKRLFVQHSLIFCCYFLCLDSLDGLVASCYESNNSKFLVASCYDLIILNFDVAKQLLVVCLREKLFFRCSPVVYVITFVFCAP